MLGTRRSPNGSLAARPWLRGTGNLTTVLCFQDLDPAMGGGPGAQAVSGSSLRVQEIDRKWGPQKVSAGQPFIKKRGSWTKWPRARKLESESVVKIGGLDAGRIS